MSEYITINVRDEFKREAQEIIKMINGYINYLEKKKKQNS